MQKTDAVRSIRMWVIDSATKRYEEHKAEFVNKVELNPVNAIEWSASMVRAQEQYVIADRIDRIAEHQQENYDAEELDALLYAMERVSAELYENLIGNHNTPTSTDMITNGVRLQQNEARSQMLRTINDGIAFVKGEA